MAVFAAGQFKPSHMPILALLKCSGPSFCVFMDSAATFMAVVVIICLSATEAPTSLRTVASRCVVAG